MPSSIAPGSFTDAVAGVAASVQTLTPFVFVGAEAVVNDQVTAAGITFPTRSAALLTVTM